MASSGSGVENMSQGFNAKDIFEPGMDFVKREVALELERLKAKKPANDNVAKLTPAWAETVNKLETNNGTTPRKDRFQITLFDDVDQTVTKEEIVQGVL